MVPLTQHTLRQFCATIEVMQLGYKPIKHKPLWEVASYMQIPKALGFLFLYVHEFEPHPSQNYVLWYLGVPQTSGAITS